jgi:hypothetical protein
MGSKFLSIDIKDVLHGLIFAVGIAIYKTFDATVSPIFDNGAMPSGEDIMKAIALSYAPAKAAAILFIGHRFFKNANGDFFKPETIMKTVAGIAVEKDIPQEEKKTIPVMPVVKPAVQGTPSPVFPDSKKG